MVPAGSPVGQDYLLGHSQAGLELGHGAASRSTVESVDRRCVSRREDGWGSCQGSEQLPPGPWVGRTDSVPHRAGLELGHRAVSGSVGRTKVRGSLSRGMNGHGSSWVLWQWGCFQCIKTTFGKLGTGAWACLL